jgi:nucleoside-diphosphate-sugar epimerase
MKVLFIGGTGIISSACTPLALQRGMEVTLLNRGQTFRHPLPEGVQIIEGDIRNPDEVERVLEGHEFDVVVDWIAFTTEHIETDLRLFQGRTKQFIFISSASAYQSPSRFPVITESTPLVNPFWQYSRNKIACEDLLMKAYRDNGFPVTIVRPSHTYDTYIPTAIGGGYTVADRILRGAPVIVHGDGTSLWTLTHSEDFAKGFVGLLGNERAIGHTFHITSDEALTWDQIYEILGDALGKKPQIVHIPSDFIARFDADTGAGLLGDKAKNAIFDNSKIKSFVPGFQATIPFREGIRRTLRWHDEDASRKVVDASTNEFLDRCLAAYNKAFEGLN